ncbi:MAG: uncharacterized protein QOF77_1414 [Solirubrobacteraceae bacterium]|jgi:uncharacterized protein YcbX|nr:uncharacterized protein [Solirubrobacteraceae bacterium]
MPVTVCALAIAPVKGMRLVGVEELEIGPSGPVGDRAFVVVEAGGEHDLVSTERTPELLQVTPDWDRVGAGRLELRFPGGEAVAAVPRAQEAVRTRLYDGRSLSGRLVAAGPLCRALSAHLGRGVRLMAVDGGETGADDFPVTLMSRASLAAVGEALGTGEPDPRRFRMTVTVEGVPAWEEHGWPGREVAVGRELRLRVIDPVPRCVVTTRHPQEGTRDAPVLRALAGLRGKDDVTFGVWCQVAAAGVVRRGDAVRVMGGERSG